MTYFACKRNAATRDVMRHLLIPLDEHAAAGKPFIETEKAYGFKFNSQMIWIPKSQCENFEFRKQDDGDIDAAETIEVDVREWLVIEKSLESFVQDWDY